MQCSLVADVGHTRLRLVRPSHWNSRPTAPPNAVEARSLRLPQQSSTSWPGTGAREPRPFPLAPSLGARLKLQPLVNLWQPWSLLYIPFLLLLKGRDLKAGDPRVVCQPPPSPLSNDVDQRHIYHVIQAAAPPTGTNLKIAVTKWLYCYERKLFSRALNYGKGRSQLKVEFKTSTNGHKKKKKLSHEKK